MIGRRGRWSQIQAIETAQEIAIKQERAVMRRMEYKGNGLQSPERLAAFLYAERRAEILINFSYRNLPPDLKKYIDGLIKKESR